MQFGERIGMTWRSLVATGGIACGAMLLAAAVTAERAAVRHRYWEAAYYQLIIATGWEAFDRWLPFGIAAAVVVTVIALLLHERVAVFGTAWLRWMFRVGAALLAVTLALRAIGVAGAFRAPRTPNLLLISIDTLRADRLGSYGHGRPTSPTIDAELVENGVTFLRCYSQSPKTTPSHMSMLTSLHPCVHGIELWEGHEEGSVLNPAVHTLAEVLKNAGYATGAFTGRGHMHRSRGFGQGFDVYMHRSRYENIQVDSRPEQLEEALEWMRAHSGGPFFIFFHTYAVHDPYVPPTHAVEMFDDPSYRGPLRSALERLRRGGRDWQAAHRVFWDSVTENDPRDVAFLQRLYDAVIRHMDDEILTPLLAELDTLGLTANTLVVFTSDHGEAFGEHGRFLHGDLFTETLQVPLIMRLPGRLPAGHRVSTPVSLVDVMPTILDVLGVAVPPAAQGRSLLPLLTRGPEEQEPADITSEHSNRARGRVFESIRRGRYTYILDGAVEQLFDHTLDPREQVNVAARQPAALREMRTALARWRRECDRRAVELGPHGEGVAPTPETIQQLRALGYIE